MPLGERGPWDKSESRYCGVETDFSDDVPHLLSFNLSLGGFDFVVATLVRPLLPVLSPKCHFFFMAVVIFRRLSSAFPSPVVRRLNCLYSLYMCIWFA